MTTANLAASFIQAHLGGYIPDLRCFSTEELGEDTTCTSDCENCPAFCDLLSDNNGTPDYTVFKENYKPVHTYLLQHHPELFI